MYLARTREFQLDYGEKVVIEFFSNSDYIIFVKPLNNKITKEDLEQIIREVELGTEENKG